MKTAALFLVVFAAGCTSVTPQAFSDKRAKRNMDVMMQCAVLISKHALVLSIEEQNWHYQQCLIQNEATI